MLSQGQFFMWDRHFKPRIDPRNMRQLVIQHKTYRGPHVLFRKLTPRQFSVDVLEVKRGAMSRSPRSPTNKRKEWLPCPPQTEKRHKSLIGGQRGHYTSTSQSYQHFITLRGTRGKKELQILKKNAD
ncbi:hypothetical protein TNCV_4025821 [Trichonephila clavipes]|nr:hypothetical protein TNCV_4025821 [Trichonephila clavipes]